MKKMFKLLSKYYVLASCGGFAYVSIEVLFRHRSDWTMMYCGAICFIMIGLINNYIDNDMALWKQMILGGIIVTCVEFVFGIIFNQDYSIWDYRNMPLNFIGQICVPFSLLWCIISILGIVLDDHLRCYLFDEDKPKYKLF